MTPYSAPAPSDSTKPTHQCSFCKEYIWFGKRLISGQLLCRACDVCFFFEKKLTLTADFAGQPFKLMPWTRQVLRDLFGTLDDDGRRQYKDVYLELPKKNSKTSICAGIVVYLLSTTRTSGTEIYSAATTKDQAAIVFDAASQMVRANKSLREMIKIIPSTKRMVLYDDPTCVYRAISADGDINDGKQPSFVVRDELHRWRTRKSLELNQILEKGMAARKEGMVIDITTAGVADESPLCYRRHEYTRRIQSGLFKDKRFYGRIWSADEEKIKADPLYWTTQEARIEANPSHEANGGYLADDILEGYLTKALNDPMEAAEYKRYNLNIWGQSGTRWMPTDRWLACSEPTRTLIHKPCYAGLDLSTTTDLSALVLVFPDDSDDTYDVLPFFWMPANNVKKRELTDKVPYTEWVEKGFITATEGDIIDTREIKKKIRWAAEMFELRELHYDKHKATELVLDLIDEGMVCVPVQQGFAGMTEPMNKIEKMVYSKKLRHGGHPVLAWNSDCLEAKGDGNDGIRPVKPNRSTSDKRIDGMVAMFNATDGCIRNEGAYNWPSVVSVKY